MPSDRPAKEREENCPYQQKDGRKHRQAWTHAFERELFSDQEIKTTKITERRHSYAASLEKYIDTLHSQLQSCGIFKPEHPPTHVVVEGRASKAAIAELFKKNLAQQEHLRRLREANEKKQALLDRCAKQTPLA
ncbi:hypothetical protein HMN09_00639500 [Mycena chlorophos]|uniref:Uncharacterized protein n=1 Tax=Mycena chlorophos TaxID=658473 RepID=A0A8H6T6P1_MYCCL|nr:hypothetical protein HMN09_00639500 [Mycena chlorophos]